MSFADIDSNSSDCSEHAASATLSPPPYTLSPSHAWRGELVRSAEPGVPTFPFEYLKLPDDDCTFKARTIIYEVRDILPHEYESIRTAVLSAFRRHFQWRKDEAPYVAFTPLPLHNFNIEVTLASTEHWDLAMEGLGWHEDGDLSSIDIRPSGPSKMMDFVCHREGEAHSVVVLAVTELPLDYDSDEVHEQLNEILCECGGAFVYDSWNVVYDSRAEKVVGQRIGTAVIVGETPRTYFEDCLAGRFPRTLRYRGRSYPLGCVGGRPRPKEAEGSSSTGALFGELPGDTVDDPIEVD